MDRRARKKARTRTLIRETAQRLFAERGFEGVTIADIAAAADVAVQTVFNHFPTKEDLFFDGHTPWVEGAAEAVRSRPRGTAPLDALHAHLVDRVALHVRQLTTPEGRLFDATLEDSPALRARERGLPAVRTLIVQHRRLLSGPAGALPGDTEQGVILACSVADQVFSGLGTAMSPPASKGLRPTG